MVLGLPHAMNAEGGASNVKYCTNSDPNCGLSGIDRSVLRDSLFKGLKDLPFGLGGRGIGFPADVLAAAYNMNDQQHEFSIRGALGAVVMFPLEATLPHYYSYRVHRAMLPRLENVLANAKLHMSEPEHAPALVALNVPGIGPRIYDADQIRALVATDLFPYPMHFEWRRSAGVLVPFVQLDRSWAQFARKCLEDLGGDSSTASPKTSNGTGCSDTAKHDIHGNVAGPAASSFLTSPSAFDGGGLSGGRKSKTTPKDGGAIEEILVRQTNDTITVTTPACTIWQEIQRDRPQMNDPGKALGCLFESKVTIPRSVGGAYSAIRITVKPLEPSDNSLLCGPDDKDLNVTKTAEKIKSPGHPCPIATWRLSGDILSPDPETNGGKSEQYLKTYVEHKLSNDDPVYKDDQTVRARIISMFQVEITLEGTLSPWWEELAAELHGDQSTYAWCVPVTACPQK